MTKGEGLTDKERILITIVRELAGTMLMKIPFRTDFKVIGGGGDEYPHPDHSIQERDLQPGMLVICQTAPTSDWSIGYLVERRGYGHWLVREIGGPRVCDISNERFVPIVGLRPEQLLEGEQLVFTRKVRRAMHRSGHEDWHRYAGVEFLSPGRARIWIRQRWGGLNHPTLPYSVEMDYTPKTTQKAITETLLAAGYGSRKFELDMKHPDNQPAQ